MSHAMRFMITRPAEDSATLSAQLAALGHETLIEPLLSILPVEFVLPTDQVAALLLTSRHGARALHWQGGYLHLADVPVHCVGPATAKAACDAGFRRVSAAAGNAASLAADVAAGVDPAAGCVLHIRGRHARSGPSTLLRQHGFDLREVVVYEAKAAHNFSPEGRRALADHLLDGVLLFSPRTARIFVGLVREAGLTAAVTALPAYCLSGAVAAPLATLRLSTRVAPAPDLDALLSLVPATEP
jgi:uroporphyrinogen-III synthase